MALIHNRIQSTSRIPVCGMRSAFKSSFLDRCWRLLPPVQGKERCMYDGFIAFLKSCRHVLMSFQYSSSWEGSVQQTVRVPRSKSLKVVLARCELLSQPTSNNKYAKSWQERLEISHASMRTHSLENMKRLQHASGFYRVALRLLSGWMNSLAVGFCSPPLASWLMGLWTKSFQASLQAFLGPRGIPWLQDVS